MFQVAHRYGDEMLLWDEWFPVPDDATVDRLAALLMAADAGDAAAERTLAQWYTGPDGLRPAGAVVQQSPYGSPAVTVDLGTRTARPSD